ncbi:hypothetical protein B0T25DRAFT_287440 [Lasiosphaeria hispida]|uniref:Uncharacterized protein n=1 Tax=Lasiosphaeria hispida TaxID=260671 RepID=A0AAJ0MB46_9PEZI|nr:hypothetical protein B0T25DRAFT_287440 [Lasiosphaeria hispida]
MGRDGEVRWEGGWIFIVLADRTLHGDWRGFSLSTWTRVSRCVDWVWFVSLWKLMGEAPRALSFLCPVWLWGYAGRREMGYLLWFCNRCRIKAKRGWLQEAGGGNNRPCCILPALSWCMYHLVVFIWVTCKDGCSSLGFFPVGMIDGWVVI